MMRWKSTEWDKIHKGLQTDVKTCGAARNYGFHKESFNEQI